MPWSPGAIARPANCRQDVPRCDIVDLQASPLPTARCSPHANTVDMGRASAVSEPASGVWACHGVGMVMQHYLRRRAGETTATALSDMGWASTTTRCAEDKRVNISASAAGARHCCSTSSWILSASSSPLLLLRQAEGIFISYLEQSAGGCLQPWQRQRFRTPPRRGRSIHSIRQAGDHPSCRDVAIAAGKAIADIHFQAFDRQRRRTACYGCRRSIGRAGPASKCCSGFRRSITPTCGFAPSSHQAGRPLCIGDQA